MACLALLTSCDSGVDEAPEQAGAQAPQHVERSFPTFEPFLASRMWEVFQGEGGLGESSVEAAYESLAATTRALSMSDDEGDDSQLSLRYGLLPGALMRLEPLWRSPSWSDDERKLAGAVAELANGLDAGLGLDFSAAGRKDPALELERLVDGFERQVADPLAYGRMILTMDDGPWLPPAVDTQAEFDVSERQSLGEDFELELGKDRDGGWCLRRREAGEVRWVRALERVPEGKFRFTGEQPTRLGSYGWKVHMRSFGEYTHLYVSREKELLFYFTSW